MHLQVETTIVKKNIFANLQIEASEVMINKLNDDAPLFFTVSIADFRELLNLAQTKDAGKTFMSCEPFFIPGSYLELHVNRDISFLAEAVAIQVRRMRNGRGLNMFASAAERGVSHKIVFNDHEIETNGLLLKTLHFGEPLTIAFLASL